MTDPRFTLLESPELLARAEAVARQRYDEWAGLTTGPGCWAWLLSGERDHYVATVAAELRDMTRPASYDAAVRWLVELLAPMAERDGWAMFRGADTWELTRWTRTGFRDFDNGLMRIRLSAVPTTVIDPREALVLALTVALEARR